LVASVFSDRQYWTFVRVKSQLGTSVIDTTIPSVSDMLNIINLPALAERRLRTRLVMMYKAAFHLDAVPSDILILQMCRRDFWLLVKTKNSCKIQILYSSGISMWMPKRVKHAFLKKIEHVLWDSRFLWIIFSDRW
jgi:hypothetical protein